RATGTSDLEVDIALWPEVVITGKVIDDDGTPVASAVVTAEAARRHVLGTMAETDEDGAFRLGGLSAMNYILAARAGDRVAEQPIAAPRPAKTIATEMRLSRRATLAGRVVMANQPVSGAMVVAVGPPAIDERELGSAVSQTDGRFR